MLEIPKDECWYEIEIGDVVRRVLIRHFTTWLRSEMQSAAIMRNPADKETFDQEPVEATAWLLTDRLIAELKNSASNELMGAGEPPDKDAGDVVQRLLNERLEEFQKEFRNNDLEWEAFLDSTVGYSNLRSYLEGGWPSPKQ